MRALLTGGNGFVGSHILDILRASGYEVALLLRRTSNTDFISSHLSELRIHYGSLADTRSLEEAVRGARIVIHCAGKTKALYPSEFDVVNRDGTRNLVSAANNCRDTLRQLLLISSLAAGGPGVPDRPAREGDPPRPLSAYGRSKLAGEQEVTRRSEVPWTILRPAAVYGPRDGDFLSLFRTVQKRIMPMLDKGEKRFSLVHVSDLAEAVLRCLSRENALGKIYNIAAEPPCSTAELLGEIAAQMDVRPLRLPIPFPVLYAVCLARGLASRITRRPDILSRDKLAELRAPGWVCSTERIRSDLGFVAATTLREGVGRTLEWYRRQGWL